ncbi:hypothetical protein ACH5RR_021368 [Cinchona calisaya]|uniref:Uncharacterized protein n=1 Tax=Cinchona calisaya TaxID=153742 RepID=A0ABD2ZI47_9GENT
MATTGGSITVLDRCLMTPPPGLVSRMSLRLTVFDMLWLYGPPVQRLVFYEIPGITKTNFLDEIIPKLKDSLTLTLKYYIPFAGNLIIPRNSDSSSPEILYKQGDSVPMILTESNTMDFELLVTNYAKDCSELYPLVPELVRLADDGSSGSIVSSVLAIQVTLFPNMGISIGLTNHQAAGDASTVFRFMKIWASYSKDGEEQTAQALDTSHGGNLAPPFYYRTVIRDPKGLSTILWNQWNSFISTDPGSGISSNTYKVRKSFLISAKNIEKLTKLVSTRLHRPVHLTSFKVVCAYVWVCLLKSRGEEVVDREEIENFVCFGNCRKLLGHLVSENYFGSCLTVCVAKGKNGELVGEGGLPRAVGLIGAAMTEKLHNKEAPLDGAEKWLIDLKNLNLDRAVRVAGAPKINFYQVDFGWGEPKKFEFVSIDKTGAISLCGGRKCKRDVEVGLSLPKARMDAFAAIFQEGLKAI